MSIETLVERARKEVFYLLAANSAVTVPDGFDYYFDHSSDYYKDPIFASFNNNISKYLSFRGFLRDSEMIELCKTQTVFDDACILESIRIIFDDLRVKTASAEGSFWLGVRKDYSLLHIKDNQHKVERTFCERLYVRFDWMLCNFFGRTPVMPLIDHFRNRLYKRFVKDIDDEESDDFYHR